MAKNQEVERIAKKLDKMVHKKNTDGALDLLRELKNIKMSLETLQSTRVGMSVNAVRKHSSEEEVQTLAKALIKSWKKLLDGAEGKSEEKEKKKKEGSPVRPSSTSKDSGSSEKSSKKSGESPPTPPRPQHPPHPPPPLLQPFPRGSPPSPRPPSPPTTCGTSVESFWLQRCRLTMTTRPLERTIFQEFKSTDIKYKTRLRSRISNLKDQKNPDLRRNVLCGSISARRIASMTAEEMASAELKQMRETLTKESIREHQLSKVGGTETDMFICNKCHGKSCSYTQVQIRSADEPMTTFVLCNSCGNRWKFC
ncbi:hypothetical protein EPR50_G00071760 [Perca flavescens]|uniref:Transcription elongation factor A (SII), 2 n=1 Tax=Perca flavescens TaxID=8167 RepID=A0A484D423_PERFV|nr:hypothetical protein EPR50_G00071760 [Perca flavescens]